MKRLLILLALGLPLLLPTARADTTVAGVKLPDRIELAGQPLLLNGAGVRSKFFIKVYVGALYLRQRSRDPARILAMPGARSMRMFMLYKKVGAGKIRDGWRDGFEANLDDAQFAALLPRLQRFNRLFPDLRKGDRVEMNYLPGQGTQLRINDRTLGSIEGEDFFNALLSVWIGDEPADKDLRRGLLGGD